MTDISLSSDLAVPAARADRRPAAWLLLTVAFAINVIWALSYPVSKLVMADLPVGALTCWRVAGAVALLAPFLRRRDFPAQPTARELVTIGLMGVLGFAAPIWLQYAGTVRTTASNVSLIVGLETVVVVILAGLFLKEAIRGRTWAGLGFAVAGVGLISVDPATLDLFSGRYAAGNALMLLSILGFASYTVLCKPLTERYSAMALTVVPLGVAAAVLVPAFWLTDAAGFARAFALSANEAMGVFFITAIATAASYMAWNWILRWVGAGKLAYSLYVQPVAGALFSAWLLKETLTPFVVWGALLILAAMVLGSESTAPSEDAPVFDDEPARAA